MDRRGLEPRTFGLQSRREYQPSPPAHNSIRYINYEIKSFHDLLLRRSKSKDFETQEIVKYVEYRPRLREVKNLPERISENLDMSINQSNYLLESLFEAGYINNQKYITVQGRKLIKILKKENANNNSIDTSINDKYYPYYKGKGC